MKQGFEAADGERIDVEDAFKDPKHRFRVAIVCAMWLTGSDVECLSTLYIDSPIKAHTLMQAIAGANRVYPGKDFGLIVDYNAMLKSLREALAQYALGDAGSGGEEIVAPIEERVQALLEAIEATETHLRGLGFDPGVLAGQHGFAAGPDAGAKSDPDGLPAEVRRDRCAYNSEKDRVTIEETFRRLADLMNALDAEQKRAVEEGLDEDELAMFDLLKKTPPFAAEEKDAVAAKVYGHIWEQAVSGGLARATL